MPIYEVGDHEEQHYFSMKFVEGGSLASRKMPLPAREAAGIREDGGGIDHLAFSPDGRWLVGPSPGSNRGITVWEAR